MPNSVGNCIGQRNIKFNGLQNLRKEDKQISNRHINTAEKWIKILQVLSSLTDKKTATKSNDYHIIAVELE